MNERPLQRTDIPKLLTLWNDNTSFDQLDEGLLIEKIWEDPDYDEHLSISIEESDLPIAMALGVVREQNDERRGFIKMLVVDTKWQRKGLGKKLVQQLELLLWHEDVSLIRAGEAAPNYLFPGIDSRYESAIKLFQSLGYERISETCNMRVDLSSNLSDPTDEMRKTFTDTIDFRRASSSDKSAVNDLVQKHWPAWQQEVAAALGNAPPSLHLAFIGDQAVGFAAYDSNNLGTGWFGPMGTDPSFQGKSIGKALLIRCLKDIQKQGHRQAIIPWVGPQEFYSRHAGAVVDRTFYRYEKKRKPERT